jgi:hypothetical protein
MTVLPELPSCQVYEGESTHRRLTQFGLKETYFSEAARTGHDRRSRCLPVHPASFGGQVMWAETLAALRTRCLDLNDGWEMGRSRGYETAFNGKHRLAIAVVGGNQNTGERAFEQPMTARPRGPITKSRVEHNMRQLELPLEGLSGKDAVPEEDCATWFFLVNARGDKLYSELSLPIIMGNRQRVSQWAERILFTTLTLVGAITPIEPDETPEQAQINVTRK